MNFDELFTAQRRWKYFPRHGRSANDAHYQVGPARVGIHATSQGEEDVAMSDGYGRGLLPWMNGGEKFQIDCVCEECGHRYGTKTTEVERWISGRCDVCGKYGSVTDGLAYGIKTITLNDVRATQENW